MVRFFSLAAAAALVCVLLGLLVFKVELALFATLAMGIVCLAWLVAILVLPWNLYFRARHLLAEMVRSERRGIAVDGAARAEAAKVESRMLKISVGLHLFSALLLAFGSWRFGQGLGYAFAGLFLLSTLFRPAAEYHRYLHEKLGSFLSEVKYPREDVVKLVGDVRAAAEAIEAHRLALEKLQQGLGELAEEARAGDREGQRRIEALHRRSEDTIGAVTRKFEETIDRLTDNQEIISGLKAFLRLIQQGRPA